MDGKPFAELLSLSGSGSVLVGKFRQLSPDEKAMVIIRNGSAGDPLLPNELFQIAATAPCDIKTVHSYFDPERRLRMKPSSCHRVRKAIEALGFENRQASLSRIAKESDIEP